MNVKTFSDAINLIDSKYIDEALLYKKVKKITLYGKWKMLAACLILTVSIIIPIINYQHQQIVADSEKKTDLTLENVIYIKNYSTLFPTQILNGYEAEGNPGIYGSDDNTILSAKFYNNELEDEMIINVASKRWFHNHEKDSFNLNTVMYRETLYGTTSYIYIESEDYIISYSFSTRDIAKIDGFIDMVNSAKDISEFNIQISTSIPEYIIK